jgi:hypothetical protein
MALPIALGLDLAPIKSLRPLPYKQQVHEQLIPKQLYSSFIVSGAFSLDALLQEYGRECMV